MAIKITKEDLVKLSEKDIITAEKVEEIWENLVNNTSKTQFTFVNVLYYLGALITISAMTWFATQAFAEFHATGLMAISIIYFCIFFFSGWYLIKREKTVIPGGLLLTIAVFMVPLLIFSIQESLGLWVFEAPGDYKDFYNWIESGWFFMEMGTILTSIIFLARFRFVFLTFPLSFTLWFLSMDLTPLIFGTYFSWDERRLVSIVFGLTMLIISYSLDKKLKKDYSFWLYLFGMIAFWGAITSGHSDSLLDKSLYCTLNLFFIFISVVFQRKLFLVFGSIGVFFFLADLSYSVFRDSLLFPVFLSFIGVGFIAIGLLYVKNREVIESFIISKTPGFIKAIVPKK